jgi:hypothetical protein
MSTSAVSVRSPARTSSSLARLVAPSAGTAPVAIRPAARPAMVASRTAGEHVVGACRQGQHRHVACGGRGHPGGAVAAEADDHPGALGHHPPDGIHGVLRGLPDRLTVEEFDLGPADVLVAMPLDDPEHRGGDAAEIGAEQHAVHADGAERGEHALDHVGLLGRREHRGLRDQAADVATGERVRHHPDDRVTQGAHLLARFARLPSKKE